MKKGKALIALFIVFAIAAMTGGVITTAQAVSASVEYKQLESGELVKLDNGATMAADKQAVVKYFSLSLLLFMAFAVSVVAITLQIVRRKE